MQNYTQDITIIGAGLSGLSLARNLVQKGMQVTVFDARNRIGGRILSVDGPAADGRRYDLGPAWVWPHNHRIHSLVKEAGLTLMPQHASGNLVFEDRDGSVRRDLQRHFMFVFPLYLYLFVGMQVEKPLMEWVGVHDLLEMFLE